VCVCVCVCVCERERERERVIFIVSVVCHFVNLFPNIFVFERKLR